MLGRIGLCALLAAVGGSVAGGTAAADAARIAYNNHCRTCHSLKEGDNRLGPSLHGVMGRVSGTLPGYPFSWGLKNAEITWDRETMDRFIENPDKVVSEHGMRPYGGITDASVRALILEALGG